MIEYTASGADGSISSDNHSGDLWGKGDGRWHGLFLLNFEGNLLVKEVV